MFSPKGKKWYLILNDDTCETVATKNNIDNHKMLVSLELIFILFFFSRTPAER